MSTGPGPNWMDQMLIGAISFLEGRVDGFFSHFQDFPDGHATISFFFVPSVWAHSGSAYQSLLPAKTDFLFPF